MKNISKLILAILITGSFAACSSKHSTSTTDTTKVSTTDTTKTTVVDTTKKTPMTTDTTKKDTTKKP
jgi:hypothetical protein